MRLGGLVAAHTQVWLPGQGLEVWGCGKYPTGLGCLLPDQICFQNQICFQTSCFQTRIVKVLVFSLGFIEKICFQNLLCFQVKSSGFLEVLAFQFLSSEVLNGFSSERIILECHRGTQLALKGRQTHDKFSNIQNEKGRGRRRSFRQTSIIVHRKIL